MSYANIPVETIIVAFFCYKHLCTRTLACKKLGSSLSGIAHRLSRFALAAGGNQRKCSQVQKDLPSWRTSRNHNLCVGPEPERLFVSAHEGPEVTIDGNVLHRR